MNTRITLVKHLCFGFICGLAKHFSRDPIVVANVREQCFLQAKVTLFKKINFENTIVGGRRKYYFNIVLIVLIQRSWK